MGHNGNGTNSRKLTDHHLTPSSRGGNGSARRILAISLEQHEAWHALFGNATLEEILAELENIRIFFEDPKNKGRRYSWKLSKTSFISCADGITEGGDNHEPKREDFDNPLPDMQSSGT